MRRNRSYLHLLDIFEVAARHGSFKNAANELHISPSAVSHQIRSLESKLGYSLFKRKPGQVILSQAGESLLKEIGSVFEQVDQLQLGELTQSQDKICLMVHENFSPALKQRIEQKLKSLNWRGELVFKEILRVEQLNQEDFDLAIRVGNGHWPGVTGVELCHAVTVLAGTAQFINDNKIKSISDLKGKRLLYNESHQRFAQLMGISVEDMGGSDNKKFCTGDKNFMDALLDGEGYSGVFWHFMKYQFDNGQLTPIEGSVRHWREKIYLIYQEDKVLDEYEQAIIELFKEDYSSAEKFSPRA